MSRIQRYSTALARHHRSGGHGIHSPFAFNFVLNVLRLRKPYTYFSYHRLATARTMVERSQRGVKAAISLSEMRLLFRITNYFNPSHILTVGSRHGLSALSMKLVSSRSEMHLYEPAFGEDSVLKPHLHSIRIHNDLPTCLHDYQCGLTEGEQPFVAVNHITQADYAPLQEMLAKAIQGNAVVVIRHLHTEPLMRQLWDDVKTRVERGQTYTNGKMGIVIASPKLNPEHFSIWL